MANTRKRVFYQSENLHVSPSGETAGNLAAADVTQIHRVQSINYSFEVTRTDVNQFGQLAAIDRVIVEQPSVSLDFNYYPTTGAEESGIGLRLGTGISAVTSIIDGKADTKNYYVFTAPEGKTRTSTSMTLVRLKTAVMVTQLMLYLVAMVMALLRLLVILVSSLSVTAS